MSRLAEYKLTACRAQSISDAIASLAVHCRRTPEAGSDEKLRRGGLVPMRNQDAIGAESNLDSFH